MIQGDLGLCMKSLSLINQLKALPEVLLYVALLVSTCTADTRETVNYKIPEKHAFHSYPVLHFPASC